MHWYGSDVVIRSVFLALPFYGASNKSSVETYLR